MHAHFGNYFLCSIAFCETKPEQRNHVQLRGDADPGIAVLLLAVMAFLFIVATYQFLTDRLEDPVGRDKRVQIEVPKAPSQ